MDPVTLGFLVVGAIGAAILLLALLVGDILHLGGPDIDGPFTLPAIAAFVGGGGFVGAAASTLLPDGDVRLWLSILIGLAAAFPLAWATVRMSRALMNMRTDGTVNESHLPGTLGTVITAIPANGLGEVRLQLAGQDVKYSARSDKPLARGAEIFVVQALSPTSVEVISVASDDPGFPPTTS